MQINGQFICSQRGVGAHYYISTDNPVPHLISPRLVEADPGYYLAQNPSVVVLSTPINRRVALSLGKCAPSPILQWPGTGGASSSFGSVVGLR